MSRTLIDFFMTKAGNALIVFAFFFAVIFFLRFLYGPKGRLRDPEWDRWNEEARLSALAGKAARADEALCAAFRRYAESFYGEDAELNASIHLKIEHSFKVLDNARELAAKEASLADPDVSRALVVAALFHDVGRFEQLRRYGTFADNLSCNHGALGAKIIRRQDFLAGESPEIRRLAVTAVAAHNRPSLPAALKGRRRLVLLALRDADKLDILRVMVDHFTPDRPGGDKVVLHLKNEPGTSPAVLAALAESRVALYSDMRYVNDFRLVLCSWLFDLHFAVSYDIVRRDGCIERVIDGLAELPEVQTLTRSMVDKALSRQQFSL
jgi:hypothetical protein